MLSLDEAKGLLGGFLASHLTSTVEESEAATGQKHLVISKPWDDDSLQIALPDEPTELIAILNSILLPDRLSAIFHKDSSKLEIIWTAVHLGKSVEDLPGRKFTFRFEAIDHLCEFGDSSRALVIISEHVNILFQTETNGRNLHSFNSYAVIERLRERNPQLKTLPSMVPIDKPRSFWIDNVTFSDESLVNMLSALNFYLTYYDINSPFVLIQPSKNKN